MELTSPREIRRSRSFGDVGGDISLTGTGIAQMKERRFRMETLEWVSERTRRAYNAAADRYHELFHDEMSRKVHDLALLDSFAKRFDDGTLVLDAGCGPCAHVGRILFDKGIPVIGIDISDRCVELARAHNPGMQIERGDLAAMPFPEGMFRGVVSYYSIIDTPKRFVAELLGGFHRVLEPDGSLLLVVKEGETEGWQDSLLDIASEIYVSTFSASEIERLLDQGGFAIESIEKRDPYSFEIEARRIYVIARAVKGAERGTNGA